VPRDHQWISVANRLPEDETLVLCYRDSPNDAEWMKFVAPKTFLDMHGIRWELGVVSHWTED